MSAGFKVADEVFWGTNGAVEAYAEALAAQAVARLGPDDPLTVFFQEERDGFYGGKILLLARAVPHHLDRGGTMSRSRSRRRRARALPDGAIRALDDGLRRRFTAAPRSGRPLGPAIGRWRSRSVPGRFRS